MVVQANTGKCVLHALQKKIITTSIDIFLQERQRHFNIILLVYFCFINHFSCLDEFHFIIEP